MDQRNVQFAGAPFRRGWDTSFVIDVFADPQLPPMTAGQIAATDFDAELTKLMEQMKDMSADELLEAVHKRLEYRLCTPCQQRYLANPLGMPRGSPVGNN
jgi:hypothetical protein